MKVNYGADESLLMKFKQGDDRAMQQFMKDTWPAFRNFMLKKGCPEDKTRELFVDSITQLWMNIDAEKLSPPLSASLKTYLFSIGHFLNLKQFSSSFGKKHQYLEETLELPEVLDLYLVIDFKAQKEWLNALLQKLDETCRNILSLFYLQDWPGESIVQELGLPSTGAFRVKKFRCLEKLRGLTGD